MAFFSSRSADSFAAKMLVRAGYLNLSTPRVKSNCNLCNLIGVFVASATPLDLLDDFRQVVPMKSNALTLESLESDVLFRTLLERLKFSEVVEEWSRCRQNLTRWEDEHLLADNPSPELLERHRKIVERLIFFGQLFSLVASRPEFDAIATAEMVQANQFILREKYQMFHQPNPMTSAQADCILKEVFPES